MRAQTSKVIGDAADRLGGIGLVELLILVPEDGHFLDPEHRRRVAQLALADDGQS